MLFSLYWRYAVRSLARGGQRTLLAIFSIAVGVMAIVALQLVGDSVNQALTSNVRIVNGGDLRLDASILQLNQSDLTYFTNLQNSGKITAYATSESFNASATTSSGNAVLFNVYAVSGNFPLVGNANFTQPSSNETFQSVLQGNNVAIESTLLSSLNLKIGDTVNAKLEDGRVVPLVIAAVYKSGGGFKGQDIYVSESYMNSVPLNGKILPAQYSTVYMLVPSAYTSAVQKQLQSQFSAARVISVQDQLNQQQQNVSNIRLFLQIVGLVALFIGGIGIVNTMQVLLRRRRVEIAMLKTVGYLKIDLYSMFGLEASLLGFIGGVIGSALGVVASIAIRNIFGSLFFVNLPAVYDSGTIGSGVAIGFATSLIFGLLPIVQASQIRPLSVLRETDEARAGSRLLSAFLLALLSLLFILLAASIIGSILKAVFVVYGGALLIGVLALGFGLLVVAISKLPVYETPSPRILIWVAIAFGGVLASLIVGGVSAGIGAGISFVFTKIGFSGASAYIISVFGALALVLISGSIVFLLAALVDAIVMLLPRQWKTAVLFAYRNIGRQSIRTTTTVTALFVGVFAIGLILVLGNGIQNTINSSLSSLFTRNVFIIVPPTDAAAAQSVVSSAKGVDNSKTINNFVAPTLQPISINGVSFKQILAADPLKTFENGKEIGQQGIYISLSSMVGYDLTSSNSAMLPPTGAGLITAGRTLTAADSGGNNVVAPSVLQLPPLSLKVGSTIVVESRDNTVTQTLTIVGFWNSNSTAAATSFGELWADQALTQKLGTFTTMQIFALSVNPDQVNALRAQLNKSVPTAQLFSIADVTSLISQVLNDVIVMLTAIASLAMIAGLIIIANAVALAMLERRREIGILKSVGHTSGSILATVLVENGLIGLLGSLVAMTLVGGAISLLSTLVFKTNLGLSLPLIGLIIAATTLVTMSIAALIAWQASRVRPIEVLRYE